MKNQNVKSYIPARQVRALTNFDHNQYESLPKLGINLNRAIVNRMIKGHRELAEMQAVAMDAIQPTITTASLGTPVQFLQNWLPGYVETMTSARRIDELAGLMISGAWEDEQVVQGVLERTGNASLYGDYTNVPLSSWNTNFVYRTVVRFEEGMQVGVLEAARAGRVNIDDSAMKREAASTSLEIIRNSVGFVGFNAGNNETYGFLNAPELGAYIPVPAGAGGSTLWANKTYLEITNDIRLAMSTLRTQSQDNINPKTEQLTLALPTDSVDYLTVTSDFGNSVQQWLDESYPGVRVVSAPELNLANGGENVMYLYADSVRDQSTDGGATMLQIVPAKFQMLGVQQLAKAYVEDYSNATAGVMVKRPFAVVRFTGI